MANWACPDDISASVLQRAQKPAVTCRLKGDNVAGMYLPVFKMEDIDPSTDVLMTTLGVAAGGAVIQSCRDTFREVMQLIIRMASLQTSFATLDEEIKMTSRRVNAL